MAASAIRDVEMRNVPSSSPSQLSSPPSAISEPESPTRYVNKGRANIEMGDGDEIVVDTATAARFGLVQPAPPPPPDVPLTAQGLPRKKPGRKPGTVVKPKAPAADGSSTTTETTKVRRPRKPRDPNAPPIQRKRKAAAADPQPAEGAGAADASAKPIPSSSASPSEPKASSTLPPPSGRQPKTELTSMRTVMDAPRSPAPEPASTAPSAPATKVAKRESNPNFMHNLLNAEPEPPARPQPQSTPPVSTTRAIFDPVRGNYDPVRETMFSRDPYGTNASSGSPRNMSQPVNRASASPSIASLVDPPVVSVISPGASQQSFHRATEPTSLPPSPSPAISMRPQAPSTAKAVLAESKRTQPAAPSSSVNKLVETTKSGFTTVSSNGGASAPPSAPVQSKKVAAVVQQDKKAKKAASSASSSPKVNSLKDGLPAIPAGSERSILDFGKAGPGEEFVAPSIVLHIPLNGETNKYINFMRMAEERYGWDALHPRQAAHRERKARIAAASAALEKNGGGGESGDEMSVDLQSDGEGSNVEMGGMGNGGGTSGPDGAPAKPARKKRNFKEDEYDRDDDFVDDSELLWEEQAAASRDGFFVYSGPLIPEVEKPPAGSEAPTRRGRGGRGRGGTARGAREGTGRGRGGGPGSRGGLGTRKPRITKVEKQQQEKEKAEREKLAQAASSSSSTKATNGTSALSLDTTPQRAEGVAMEL